MTISINWGTKVIYVPKADTTLIQASPEIRELNLNTFRLTLKNIEDDEEGMPFPNTHNHNPPVTVGGVTLARVVEILSPYTVMFEDGQYAVNLVGGNNNISDKTNVNQVSVRSSNSAGMIDTNIPSIVQNKLETNNPTLIQSLWNKPLSEITQSNTIGDHIKQKVLTLSKFIAIK